MRVVFMGSGKLACPALDALVACPAVEVAAVVTQPDRPRGRRRKLAPCMAKSQAERLGLTVLSPDKVGSAESVGALRALKPDLIVVAAYGQYIPPSVLTLPPSGAINIHPSLLPAYRGASPVQWAIANGEEQTGVTILYVSKDMDAGDIILQEEAVIGPEDTTATLLPRLAELGATLMLEAVNLIKHGEAPRTPQDEEQASYVHKLTKADGRIDWTMPAKAIRDRIRGFQPWPCCYCQIPAGSGHQLRVLRASVVDGVGSTAGEVLEAGKEGPLIATGQNCLRLEEVQPAGKKPMSGGAYLNGRPLKVGERLG